jgi:rubrerythrin
LLAYLHTYMHAHHSGLLTMRCKEMRDREILRVGMIAELDAVNLYEQLAAMADDAKIKAVLMDIAKEEKTHMGEFQTLLLMKDKEQVEELAKGKEEVEELFE